MYNEGGVTHTITVPAVITDFVESIADGARLDHRQLQGRRRHHGRLIIAQRRGTCSASR